MFAFENFVKKDKIFLTNVKALEILNPALDIFFFGRPHNRFFDS